MCPKRPQAQVNALVVNELDVVLNDDVLNQLAVEDTLAEDFFQLSLNAMAGTDKGDALRVRALVQNKVMLILVDSGSSHSFVSKAFLETVRCQVLPTTPRQVKLANGEIMITDQWVPKMEWWTNGYTLHSDMKALELGAYDAILGYDWLQAHSPMNCHWANKTLGFVDQGQHVILQGLQPIQLKSQEASIEQVSKWARGNDLWALAVVEATLPMEPIPEKPEIQTLLDQYQDVFHQPTELPPARFYDHQIPLIPGSAPVNSKPYRYSPQHKDEIEKQVQALLAAGLITPSASPFASPVILVLKKDEVGGSVSITGS